MYLKTDWSAEEMGWILMQPIDNVESTKTTKALLNSGECTVDPSKDVTRLSSVRFGLKACTNFEHKYHSFVGEATSGRWSKSQSRHYLWENKCCLMCD